MIEFIDKTTTDTGTKINRRNLMALQGFIATETTYNADGSVTQKNEDGHELTIVFNSDGSVTETFTGEKTITRITRVDELGNVSEVIT